MHIPQRRALFFVLTICSVIGCRNTPQTATPLTVFAGGSLVRPLRAALDSIAASGGPTVQLEIMGSREIIRAVTSLGRSPDLIVTADADVIESALIPAYVAASETFARNRIVLALAPRGRLSDSVTVGNWAEIAASGRLRIARADPARAPLGYRTAIVWKLAELSMQRPGLAAQLALASPDAIMRGNEADLASLVQTGEVDAAWCYESLAKALKLKYITLGNQIDLGSAADSLTYMRASVRVAGDRPGDSVVIAGSPIRYAMAIVTNGADVVGAATLRDRLQDSTSRRIMRRAGLDVLDSVRVTTLRSKMRIAQ